MSQALIRRDSNLPAARGSHYLWKVLSSPFNPYMAMAVAAFALITGHFVVLPFAAAAELAVLGILPRLKSFRRNVDQGEAEDEANREQRKADALAMRMAERHRSEYDRLRYLVDEAKANDHRHGVVEERATERAMMDRMVEDYMRLALRYRDSAEALAVADRQRLEENLELFGSMSGHGDESVERLLGFRRQIAVRHLEFWNRTRLELERLGHQLAAISEAITSAYARSVVHGPISEPIDPEDGLREAEEIAGEIAECSARQ